MAKSVFAVFIICIVIGHSIGEYDALSSRLPVKNINRVSSLRTAVIRGKRVETAEIVPGTQDSRTSIVEQISKEMAKAEPVSNMQKEDAAFRSKIETLMNWLHRNGADTSSSSAICAPDSSGNMQRGVITTEDLASTGFPLLAIPRRLLLCVDDAATHLQYRAQNMTDSVEAALAVRHMQDIDVKLVIAAVIATRGRLLCKNMPSYVCSVPMRRMGLVLPHPRLRDFQPYYDIMPQSGEMGHIPINWSPAEVESLRGLALHKKVLERLRRLRTAYEKLKGVGLLKVFDPAELSQESALQQQGEVLDEATDLRNPSSLSVPKDVHAEPSFDAFKTAYSNVIARGFGLNMTPQHQICMVPMGDLLNESIEKRSVHWGFETAHNAYIMRTRQPLHRGEEIFDSYGDSKAADMFLFLYGFVPEEFIPAGFVRDSAKKYADVLHELGRLGKVAIDFTPRPPTATEN